jgi:hypothetical protein
MPFTITISSYQKQIGIITGFNAGPNETITCQPGNTLIATVNGNLEGHTFTWIQLPPPGNTSIPVGEAVMWLTGTPINGGTSGTITGNHVSATYMQNDESDKYFGFYIDYGTAIQQVATTINFNRPIAFQYVIGEPANTIFSHGAYGLNFARTLQPGTNLVLTPVATMNGVANSPPSTYALQATISADANQISSVIVQVDTGSGWTTLGVYPGSAINASGTFVYSPAYINYSYRILLVYSGTPGLFATVPVIEPSQAIFATITSPAIAGLSVETVGVNSATTSLFSNYSYTIPTATALDIRTTPDIETVGVNSATRSSMSAYSYSIPTATALDIRTTPDIETVGVNSATHPTIPVYQYTIPGGGNVGG